MKKTIFITLAIGLIALSAGFGTDWKRSGNPGITGQWKWSPCGRTPVTNEPNGVYAASATEPNSLECDATTFEASFQTFEIPEKWSYLSFRNSSTTDADSTVYIIYFSDGIDYVPAFQLTFTTGTLANTNQSGSEFADTLTVTHYLTSEDATARTYSPENNYMAMFACDRRWASKIGIVPTTVTNSAYLEIVGYGQ